MKTIVFLATGFEETEAIGTIDLLRRADLETLTVSVTGNKTVLGDHNIPVIADELFENVDFSGYDAFILPGGGPGSVFLNKHPELRTLLVEKNNEKKLIAAICASPRVLGSLGLLKGKEATCFPGIEPELTAAIMVDKPAVTDGNIITGKGPALVFDFALEIITYLYGDKKVANEVAQGLLLK
jgi:4-methyl-5(b-hydroxyethyl)-thiazole monophosphate biosynthesis